MRSPILHIAPFLWSGAGSVITRLAEHQVRRRPVVLVTTGTSDGVHDWPSYRSRLRMAGVRHHAVDAFHRDPERFWASAARVATLLADLRPAVIHAHAGVPAALAVVARSLSGSRARIVGQMYSWGPDRPAWMNQQDGWAFAQADHVVCSAHEYRHRLISLGVRAGQMTYLPWGLPLETLPWRPTAPRRDAPQPRPVVGFVGRLEPRKGQLALVEAFARLARVLPAARLELVGPTADAAYADLVRTAVKTHGLDDRVSLTGKVRDVAARLACWNLFVSLSADEGQGLAVLEAMAVGVPVLARPVAGIADFLIHGRTGLSLPRTAPAVVAAAMRRALADPRATRAIATRARRMVERHYDWNDTVRAFDRLYRA